MVTHVVIDDESENEIQEKSWVTLKQSIYRQDTLKAGRAARSAAISVQAGVLWFLDKYN